MACINAIDCASVFSVQDATAKLHDVQRYNFNYTRASPKKVGVEARKQLGFAPAETNLAIVALDPTSDPQRRLCRCPGQDGLRGRSRRLPRRIRVIAARTATRRRSGIQKHHFVCAPHFIHGGPPREILGLAAARRYSFLRRLLAVATIGAAVERRRGSRLFL